MCVCVCVCVCVSTTTWISSHRTESPQMATALSVRHERPKREARKQTLLPMSTKERGENLRCTHRRSADDSTRSLRRDRRHLKGADAVVDDKAIRVLCLPGRQRLGGEQHAVQVGPGETPDEERKKKAIVVWVRELAKPKKKAQTQRGRPARASQAKKDRRQGRDKLHV